MVIIKIEYIPRIVDKILKERLESSGAVLIEGAKWSGKTRTAVENSNSHLFLHDLDSRRHNLEIVSLKPSLLLEGETPRLLDEWQEFPILFDAVRHVVDMRGEVGQFILTGSTVPKDNVVKHSGTGRISRMTMRPMSLFESRDSNGLVSLSDLFNGKNDIGSISELTIEQIANVIVRGGWPSSIDKSDKVSFRQSIDYVEAIINRDVSQVDGIQKNPERVRALMRSLSRNIATLAKIKTLYDDIATSDSGDTISEKTISQYLMSLDKIFVTDNVLAWNPVIRSSSAIRTAVKRNFVDPSIATAVLRLTPEKLFEDFNYFGFLFESLSLRDLKIYAESIDGQVFYYRDSSGLECDAVIVLNDGRWAAVEVNLGTYQIEETVKKLFKLKDVVNTSKMKEPSFLMILTGDKYSYQRKDGVFIVSIGSLRN